MWTHWVCDTLTGVKLLQVAPSGHGWRTVLNAIGDGSHTFQLRDEDTRLPRATWQDLARPWMRTLVTCWNDQPQYAGIIDQHTYKKETGVLTITHAEPRVILNRRFGSKVPAYWPGGTLAFANRSLRGLAIAVLRHGTQTTPGDQWHLPIVIPGDEAGSESRTWFLYEFLSIEEMLTEIQDTVGGPDIHLRPRWSASNTLEWEARFGTPRLSGSTLEWNASAEDSPVLDLTQITDGKKQLTGVFGVGKGSEMDMRVGLGADIGGSRIPFIDTTRSFKNVDDQNDLNRLAAADLATFREPTQQFAFGTLASEALPALTVGSVVRVYTQGDEFIDDGWKPLYVIGLGGDGSENLTLEVQ